MQHAVTTVCMRFESDLHMHLPIYDAREPAKTKIFLSCYRESKIVADVNCHDSIMTPSNQYHQSLTRPIVLNLSGPFATTDSQVYI